MARKPAPNGATTWDANGCDAAAPERPTILPTPHGRRTRDTAATRSLRRVGILGTGSCLPDRVLTNRELERLVETSDAWIRERTGVNERRIARPGQAASDLATDAARRALEACGLHADAVELIVVATVTPDNICPPTACHVQRKIGAAGAAGFDVAAACSGFANALLVGHGLVAAGTFGNALVIGVDVLSAITDYADRNTCVLFGDGAGAVVIGPEPSEHEILDHEVGIDGTGADLIEVPAGGSARPACLQTVSAREHFIRMDGRKVFRFAVAKICEVVTRIAQRNGIAVDEIDVLVPHQANLRILEAAAQKLGLPMERLLVNVDRYGNTSSGSIPIALDEAARTGRLRRGDLVCTVAFGGGLSWGANLIEW
ncbi:MAG: beta-ketoacyl-ACP synthase III [Planctomycetota bacterium]